MDDLTGRVALVTGATRGIGEAIARALAAAGAAVVLTGRDLAGAEAAAARVVGAVGSALADSGGMLITMGSLAGSNAFAGGATYNASKFGLLGFTEAVMRGLRDVGVRVATVMPGSVATSFSGRAPDAADAWKLRPDDVAGAVLYLLRKASRALPSRIELRPARRRPLVRT